MTRVLGVVFDDNFDMPRDASNFAIASTSVRLTSIYTDQSPDAQKWPSYFSRRYRKKARLDSAIHRRSVGRTSEHAGHDLVSVFEEATDGIMTQLLMRYLLDKNIR